MKKIAFFVFMLSFSYSTLFAEVTNEILSSAANTAIDVAKDVVSDVVGDAAKDIVSDVVKDVVSDVAKDTIASTVSSVANMPAVAIAMMNLTENTKNEVLVQQQYNIGAVVATQEGVTLSSNERLFNEQKLNGLLNIGNSIRAIERGQ